MFRLRKGFSARVFTIKPRSLYEQDWGGGSGGGYQGGGDGDQGGGNQDQNNGGDKSQIDNLNEALRQTREELKSLKDWKATKEAEEKSAADKAAEEKAKAEWNFKEIETKWNTEKADMEAKLTELNPYKDKWETHLKTSVDALLKQIPEAKKKEAETLLEGFTLEQQLAKLPVIVQNFTKSFGKWPDASGNNAGGQGGGVDFSGAKSTADALKQIIVKRS